MPLSSNTHSVRRKPSLCPSYWSLLWWVWFKHSHPNALTLGGILPTCPLPISYLIGSIWMLWTLLCNGCWVWNGFLHLKVSPMWSWNSGSQSSSDAVWSFKTLLHSVTPPKYYVVSHAPLLLWLCHCCWISRWISDRQDIWYATILKEPFTPREIETYRLRTPY